jgi:hypothetical protein
MSFNPNLARAARCAVAAALLAAFAAGCGQGSAPGTPAVRALPLAPGARIVQRTRTCDGGEHPYCAVQLVLTGDFRSSGALMEAETAQLHGHGWTETQGDTVHEEAAESPGHRLRVTYGQGSEDLLSIEQGRIHRAPAVARALSRAMFARSAALSLILQAGSS